VGRRAGEQQGTGRACGGENRWAAAPGGVRSWRRRGRTSGMALEKNWLRKNRGTDFIDNRRALWSNSKRPGRHPLECNQVASFVDAVQRVCVGEARVVGKGRPQQCTWERTRATWPRRTAIFRHRVGRYAFTSLYSTLQQGYPEGGGAHPRFSPRNPRHRGYISCRAVPHGAPCTAPFSTPRRRFPTHGRRSTQGVPRLPPSGRVRTARDGHRRSGRFQANKQV